MRSLVPTPFTQRSSMTPKSTFGVVSLLRVSDSEGIHGRGVIQADSLSSRCTTRLGREVIFQQGNDPKRTAKINKRYIPRQKSKVSSNCWSGHHSCPISIRLEISGTSWTVVSKLGKSTHLKVFSNACKMGGQSWTHSILTIWLTVSCSRSLPPLGVLSPIFSSPATLVHRPTKFVRSSTTIILMMLVFGRLRPSDFNTTYFLSRSIS